MIKSWLHKGLKQFFKTGRIAGINAVHAPRLARPLRHLDDANTPHDMNIPGWELHPLRGAMAGMWAVKVSANWRLIFGFDGKHAVRVDYVDYH